MSTDAGGVDELVDNLESALKRVEAAEGGSVRLTASEVELRERCQQIRDLMLEVLIDDSHRARLLHVFGGECLRIGRIRAVLDTSKSVLASKTDESSDEDFPKDMIQDTIFSTCLETCLSIEEVLRDLGHDKALSSAKEESHRKINDWWCQIHDVPNETVLDAVKEEHVHEATVADPELLVESGDSQPGAFGHVAVGCQYTVLNSDSSDKKGADWCQMHGMSHETVLNAVKEQHVHEATVRDTELLVDSCHRQPGVFGHVAAVCQYAVLNSDSSDKKGADWCQMHGMSNETVLNAVKEQHVYETTVGDIELLVDSVHRQPNVFGHVAADCQYAVLNSDSSDKKGVGWCQMHGMSNETVLNAVKEHVNEATVGDMELLVDSGHRQPDVFGHVAADCQYAVLQKGAEWDESSCTVTDCNFSVEHVSSIVESVHNDVASKVAHVPVELNYSLENTRTIDSPLQQTVEAVNVSVECRYSLESLCPAVMPPTRAAERTEITAESKYGLESKTAGDGPLAQAAKACNGLAECRYGLERRYAPEGLFEGVAKRDHVATRSPTDGLMPEDKALGGTIASECRYHLENPRAIKKPLADPGPVITSSKLGSTLAKRRCGIEGVRPATILLPGPAEAGGYTIAKDHCSIGSEQVQPHEVAEAGCSGKHSNGGKRRQAVAEVTDATSFAVPSRTEPIAAPCQTGPLKACIKMQWCMPRVSHLATSSHAEAVQSTTQACAEDVPVVGSLAVCSPVVAKGQLLSPSIQDIKFRTPASSWRTCAATEPTCMHIVKPSTEVASTSSRAAVMSHDVFGSAQNPEVVRKLLDPSRVRRYDAGRAVEDASIIRGSSARVSDTTSSGGVVGAIQPAPETRWRSTGLISEPIAVPRVPLVAVEPIGQMSCACGKIRLHHSQLWSTAALAPGMSTKLVAVWVPTH